MRIRHKVVVRSDPSPNTLRTLLAAHEAHGYEAMHIERDFIVFVKRDDDGSEDSLFGLILGR